MNKSLELIKTELDWLDKKYKITSDHLRNKFEEVLKYSIVYNRKKTVLILKFIYMPNEIALGMTYEYRIKNKDDEYLEVHSFADVLQDKELPGIDPEDIKRLKDNIKFELFEGKIRGAVSPNTQAVTYTEVIKRNIDSMLEYGKTIERNDIKKEV